jgi:hypothetical protein
VLLYLPALDSTKKDYRDRLALLEWQLKSLSLTDSTNNTSCAAEEHAMLKIMELYRLATLTYLERASGNQSRQSNKLSRWTKKAFTMLSELETCRWQFPLLIFGCEARCDDRRMIIMKLISRTEKSAHVRSFNTISSIIQFIWGQASLLHLQVPHLLGA